MDKAYIELLAQNTATDISKWNMEEIFGEVVDKRDINKIFFAYRHSLENLEKPAEEKVTMPEDSRKALDNTKLIHKLQLNIRRAQKRIQTLSDKMEETQQAIIADNQRIEGLRTGAPDRFFDDQIEEILKAGFWENPIFEGKYLYLNTKNDVIMRQTTKLVDKDKATLNFGKFGVGIDLSTFTLYVTAYENNISVVNDWYYIHPYRFYDGRMCFGTASRVLSTLKSALNLPGVMKLLASLLTTYDNDSSPVMGIDRFILQGAKVDYPKYFNWCVQIRGISHPSIHPMMKKKYT